MACADGFFYIYEVNTQTGGECKLLSQTSILTSNRTIFSNGIAAAASVASNSASNIGKDIVNNDEMNSLPVTTEN